MSKNNVGAAVAADPYSDYRGAVEPGITLERNDLRHVPEHICVRDRVGTKWFFDAIHGWRFRRDGVAYAPTYLSPDFWTWLAPFTAIG